MCSPASVLDVPQRYATMARMMIATQILIVTIQIALMRAIASRFATQLRQMSMIGAAKGLATPGQAAQGSSPVVAMIIGKTALISQVVQVSGNVRMQLIYPWMMIMIMIVTIP